MSIIFYSYWDIGFTPLLIASILLNFFLSKFFEIDIIYSRKKIILIFGIVLNILFLCFFKYLVMITNTLFFFTNVNLDLVSVQLPLGISFFTFLQIAYLIDKFRQTTDRYDFSSYFLFVSFFPHLIAGPLVHHSQLIPQFKNISRLRLDNFCVGLFIFLIGLSKKIIIVGTVSTWSDNLFDGVIIGSEPTFIDSWIGVFAFSFQIYFDFSAYSDMAIGLSKMIGIILPINFNSPYKSKSIIEFWRNWHVTLSNFLRDYLYFALGGNKKGVKKKYINIIIVMFCAGLWHGASWLFVLWGALHGFLLVINHMIRTYKIFTFSKLIKVPIIFILITLLWVPFRSETYDCMISILKGLFGLNGFSLPFHYQQKFPLLLDIQDNLNITFSNLVVYSNKNQLFILLFLTMFVWFFPNTQQITSNYKPVINKIEQFYIKNINFPFNYMTGIICGASFSYILLLCVQGNPGEFIYFQF